MGRNRERFVSLPEGPDGQPQEQEVPVPTIFEDLYDGLAPGMMGRLRVYCTAEAYDFPELEKRLQERRSRFYVEKIKDDETVIYGQYWRPGMSEPRGDIFYFDFGVVCFWGLTKRDEEDVIASIVRPCQLQPLPFDTNKKRALEGEMEKFTFTYTATEKPHIQNDTITLNYRLASDYLTKLSICFALAQSTKLLVYEKRVTEIVQSTRSLPEALAISGKVHMTRKQIAQLIGKVFIQKSAVNLISSVLDTPEFFWTARDNQQILYKKVCEYLEYDTRIEVLNNRFHVLQEMLDMLRDQQNAHHAGRLELIVIWLIVIEVVVGLLEVAGLFGWIGHD